MAITETLPYWREQKKKLKKESRKPQQEKPPKPWHFSQAPLKQKLNPPLPEILSPSIPFPFLAFPSPPHQRRRAKNKRYANSWKPRRDGGCRGGSARAGRGRDGRAQQSAAVPSQAARQRGFRRSHRHLRSWYLHRRSSLSPARTSRLMFRAEFCVP
jgi:hypothetical protein